MIIKKINLLGILLFLASVTITNAQIGSNYSMLGLGDVANPGFGQSKAMGGIGLGIRSNQHLNTINPAGYTALDSMTVLYEVGLSGGYNSVESNAGNTTKQDASIDYFALGMKVKRWWGMGFGITPSTRVNYTLLSETASSDAGSYSTYYHGEGGLTRAFWTNSFDVFDNLSLGISAGYVFGNIDRITSVVFNEYTSYTNNTKYEYRLNVNDFSFNYGLQYTLPINDKNKFVIGLMYENKMKMNAKTNEFGITTIGAEYKENITYDIDNSYVRDTIFYREDSATTLTLPSRIGAGLTYYHANNLMIGADIQMDRWSELESDEIDDVYKNALSYRAGMEWTPDINSLNSYMKRIRYRFGGHYTQSHMVVKEQRINDYGLSLGFGLPLKNSNTSFNISAELGQRGTMEQNLLLETYGIISLNLSLSDIWFFKRKYK